MKFALIPTRRTPEVDKDLPIGTYLRRNGWSVVYIENKESIFAAYSAALEEVVRPDDSVILCHDDIRILTDGALFNEIIDSKLSKTDTGFIGVAGTQFLSKTGVWWDKLGTYNPNGGQTNPLCGVVYHGDSILSMTPTFYGGHSRVVALDGVFLAAKGKTIKSIKISKPPTFEGGWDFYDIYYTVQAHLRDLKNYCVPIHILHQSVGNLKDGWYKNKEAFLDKFGKLLPLTIQ